MFIYEDGDLTLQYFINKVHNPKTAFNNTKVSHSLFAINDKKSFGAIQQILKEVFNAAINFTNVSY
jgi:uncharacterized protein (DUF1015 family)